MQNEDAAFGTGVSATQEGLPTQAKFILERIDQRWPVDSA